MTSIEEILGYSFTDKQRLREALTHKSYSSESGFLNHNERLEFLGDSVLGLVVSCYLFKRYPGNDEGYLSKIKSALVSQPSLAKWAGELGLGQHLLLGVGENLTGGKGRSSILSNALEALIGAIYIDGGIAPAEKFITAWLAVQKEELLQTDYKSALQERIQKRHKTPPEYEVMDTQGPEHDKVFTMRVRIGKKILGMGYGKNKKEAEQSAAECALAYLENHEVHRHEL
jgi:ribonuclease-3